jgi:hypothetical protein
LFGHEFDIAVFHDSPFISGGDLECKHRSSISIVCVLGFQFGNKAKNSIGRKGQHSEKLVLTRQEHKQSMQRAN